MFDDVVDKSVVYCFLYSQYSIPAVDRYTVKLAIMLLHVAGSLWQKLETWLLMPRRKRRS